MSCNAWNHAPDCDCGWGGDTGGGGGILSPSELKNAKIEKWVKEGWLKSSFHFYESFTDPNAKCPVCGAPVFFYQSPFGGRVFFDELGPPWPKHPCTDNTPVSSSIRKVPETGKKNPKQPQWKIDQWLPLADIWVRIKYLNGPTSWLYRKPEWNGTPICEVLATVLPKNQKIGFFCEINGRLDPSWPAYIYGPTMKSMPSVSCLWITTEMDFESVSERSVVLMTESQLKSANYDRARNL
jgi:hypothetical protein